MLDDMRRQTEDVIRYYGELNRRVGHAGIDGIAGLLEAAKQVELAVGQVAGQELEWIGTEIKRLLDQLVQMDAQLQRLRELKLVVNGAGEGEPTPEKRPAF